MTCWLVVVVPGLALRGLALWVNNDMLVSCCGSWLGPAWLGIVGKRRRICFLTDFMQGYSGGAIPKILFKRFMLKIYAGKEAYIIDSQIGLSQGSKLRVARLPGASEKMTRASRNC